MALAAARQPLHHQAMQSTPSERSLPLGLLLILPVAIVLWALLLANAVNQPSGGGESSMAAAFAGLFVTLGLWLVLALMLVVAGITGSMPRWVGFLALVLVPMSGVAAFTALDMVSRHMPWAIVFLILLPILIVFYAFWARLPALRSALDAQRTSAAVWGSVFALSVVAFVLAA
jgi:hypothetical protein